MNLRLVALKLLIMNCLFFCSVLTAATAEQDLQTSYQSDKKALADLLSQLTELPESVKKTWVASLKSADGKIDLAYTHALQAIKPFEAKLNSTNLTDKINALEQISSISGAAQQQIQQITNGVVIDVKQKLAVYLNSSAAEDAKKNLAKKLEEEKKLQQAYEANQQKMVAELESLEKLYEPFNKALNATQLYYVQNNQKPYDPAKVQALVQQWQEVIAFSFNVYKSFGALDVKNSNNFLIISIKKLYDFLLNTINDQLRMVRDKKLTDVSYQVISDSVTKLLGSNNSKDIPIVRYGFDGIVQNEIKKYFSDANQQAVLLNEYWQKKIQITFNAYKNALQFLSNTINNPTDQQREYALTMYKGLMSELAVMSQSNKTVIDDTKLINIAMGILYANSAQSLLKNLQAAQDNTPLIKQLIEYYKQASSYFGLAGEDKTSKTNLGLSKSLSDALTALTQAQAIQKSSDMSKTIALYKQARSLFFAGRDLVDSNKILITLSDLESKNALKVGGELFNQFESNNKAIIDAYLNYSNTLEGKLTTQQRDQFFSNVIQLYQSAINAYQDAVDTYNELRKNNPSLVQSAEVETLNNNLASAVTLLPLLMQAHDLLQKGDRFLVLKSIADLQHAESTYYQNAVQLFKKSDLMYAANQALNTYVPPYFLKKVSESPFNFEILAQRYSAKLSIELADQLSEDLVTQLAYYTNAANRKEYLPTTFQTFLSAKLSELSQTKDTVEKLFAELQTTQKKLLALTATDWEPQKESSFYTSQASQQWEQLLQQYLSLYHSGKIEAKAAFITALNQFAENYKLYVLTNPELGLALIWFQEFILHVNDNQEKEAATIKQQIDQVLEASYEKIQALISSVANQANLLTTATSDQMKIVDWTAQFDHALDQQKNILNGVGIALTPEQRPTFNILDKEVKNETVIYNFTSIKKNIEISNPVLKLADLYKQVGDRYFELKNFKLAFFSYNLARQRYAAAGHVVSSEFTSRLALSNTLYLASEYRDLIVPQGQVTVVGLQVPESYELKLYGQPVPTDISDQFPNLDFLKTDPAKTMDFLINTAVTIYVYNMINDPEKFATLIPLLSLKYDELINNTTFKALDDDEKVSFVELVGYAGAMKALFQDRANKKLMNFVLQQKANKSYVIYIYSLPIPQIIDETTKNYYLGYPSVTVYYNWSAKLFKPEPPNVISVGQATLPAGNDKQEYDAMMTKQILVYLSQGYSYQSQLNNLQQGALWKKLVSANKKDMTVVLDSYLELKATVDNLFNQMYKYYTLPIASGLVAKTDPLYKKLQNLQGVTYKNWGDTLVNFLVGDPLSFNYVDILQDILKKYIIAITTYNFDSSLYAQMAGYHNAAGNILVEQGKYFDSISYFYTAAALSKNIKPQTADVQKAINQYYINYLSALTKGSTLKMGQFQKALKEPITIADTGETISFNDLLLKYLSQGSSAEGITAEETAAMDDLKNLVLDALIFYNVSNSYITQGISNINEPSLLTWLGIDEATTKKVHEDGLGLLTTFSEKNNIAFDTLSSVTLMMNRTDFPDGKDFVEMINSGFASFENKVKTASDNVTRAVGYSAIGQFALKLYEAFSYLYMYIYYGTISAEAIENSLSPAIKARTNEILSPSKLYIG